MKRARLAVEQARQELEARRSKLALPVDKTDMYGLTRRAELRAYLRSLPEGERRAIGANVENLDAETALAIREMPAALSGMLETDHARVVDHAMKVHHGDAVGEITETEEAIKVAEAALTMAREEVAQEAGGLPKFNSASEPYEAALGALWLRTVTDADGTDVTKVFKQTGADRGAWIDALPNEVEAGRFFANYD